MLLHYCVVCHSSCRYALGHKHYTYNPMRPEWIAKEEPGKNSWYISTIQIDAIELHEFVVGVLRVENILAASEP